MGILKNKDVLSGMNSTKQSIVEGACLLNELDSKTLDSFRNGGVSMKNLNSSVNKYRGSIMTRSKSRKALHENNTEQREVLSELANHSRISLENQKKRTF